MAEAPRVPGAADRRDDGRRASARAAFATAALAMTVGLAACSSVPDALNPVEWYRGIEDVFTEDEAEAESRAEATAPAPSAAEAGADKPFPNLAEVPERPQASTAAEREALAEGLVADREGRRYAAAVERQGAAVDPLTPPSGTRAAVSTPPPPPAAIAEAETPSPAAGQRPPAPPRVSEAPAAPSAPPSPPAVRPAPEPAAQMAAAPTGVESTFRQRLRDPVPQGAALGVRPANALVIGPRGPLNTVVVSSSGVEAVDLQPGGAMAAPLFSSPARFARAAEAGVAPSGGSVRVATILFSNGSSKLNTRDKGILREVSVLHRQRGGTVRVVGHASSRTRNMDVVRHKMVNFRISADRANVVAGELARLGVPGDQIEVAALSDEQPVFYEIMPSGEAGNRRAEVYLIF